MGVGSESERCENLLTGPLSKVARPMPVASPVPVRSLATCPSVLRVSKSPSNCTRKLSLIEYPYILSRNPLVSCLRLLALPKQLPHLQSSNRCLMKP